METKVIDHPLVAQLLTLLRDETTGRAQFRQALDDLSVMLVYEATRDLRTESVEIRTPLAATTGTKVSEPPLVVPVLRAGLGMMGAAQRLLPFTATGYIGVARNETTLEPEPYMNSVPDDLAGRPVLVLDPMLATGGSLEFTCRILAEHNAGAQTVVCVLAAPEGISRLRGCGLVGTLVTAAVDERLNDDAYIHPGLGDAGDRQFGTA